MTTYELRDSKQAAESFQLSPSRTVYLSICHMFVADGLKFVLLVTVRFAPGTIIYVWARGAERASVHPVELVIFVVVLIGVPSASTAS